MNKFNNKFSKATDTFIELISIYLVVIVICAFLYSIFESKTFYDSIWWAFVSAMTVGYGDMYPITLGGRVVAVFIMHIIPLIIIPLITARLASKLIVDDNVFDSNEQEELKEGIRSIKNHLGIK